MVTLTPEIEGLYPFERHELKLSSGHSLSYLDEGEGRPILMVHGNPTWSFYYRELVKELRGNHRVIVPDHIGAGFSDKPVDYPYRLENHIDNLNELITALDLKEYTLIVHDWGGLIGFGAALKAPERVRSLVVFNTALSFLGAAPASIRLCRGAFGPMLIQGANAFIRLGLHWATANRPHFKGPVSKAFLAPYPTWDSRLGQLRFIQDIPFNDTHHPSYETVCSVDEGSSQFSQLPTCVIWGDLDFVFTPVYREDITKRFHNAEVHAMKDASHWIVEDAIDRIKPIVSEFVNRVVA
jgi:pimeloyl-ACP methyl ester carboxylesterase